MANTNKYTWHLPMTEDSFREAIRDRYEAGVYITNEFFTSDNKTESLDDLATMIEETTGMKFFNEEISDLVIIFHIIMYQLDQYVSDNKLEMTDESNFKKYEEKLIEFTDQILDDICLNNLKTKYLELYETIRSKDKQEVEELFEDHLDEYAVKDTALEPKEESSEMPNRDNDNKTDESINSETEVLSNTENTAPKEETSEVENEKSNKPGGRKISF